MIKQKRAFGIVFHLLTLSCLLASGLLTACNWNQPMEPFIRDQTAEVTGFTLRCGGLDIPLTDRFILIPPVSGGTSEFILELNFVYSGSHELAFQARMAKNGAEPVDVPVTRTGSHTVTIAISGAKSEDRFELTLYIRTADGFRNFDDFVFPVIYCADPGNPASAGEYPTVASYIKKMADEYFGQNKEGGTVVSGAGER